MNFLHKSKVDPLTKTHFFCLVHVIPISHLSYPPGPLVVFWETPSRNFLFFWPGLISWLHRFLKSVVSFRARPSRVISMFSSGVLLLIVVFIKGGWVNFNAFLTSNFLDKNTLLSNAATLSLLF